MNLMTCGDLKCRVLFLLIQELQIKERKEGIQMEGMEAYETLLDFFELLKVDLKKRVFMS